MCLTRVWLIPAAHTSAADGVNEKNRVKNRRKKYYEMTAVFHFFFFFHYYIIFLYSVPKSFSACVTCCIARYRRPRDPYFIYTYCTCIVIIALRFFQEIKRTRQLSSRYSSITRVLSSVVVMSTMAYHYSYIYILYGVGYRQTLDFKFAITLKYVQFFNFVITTYYHILYYVRSHYILQTIIILTPCTTAVLYIVA